MTNVLVIGAHGKIAQLTEKFLVADDSIKTSLFLRDAKRLENLKDKATIYDGDAADASQLEKVMVGQDVVYCNLSGENIVDQAKAVVKAMDNSNVKRLIWISTLGIYDEVPGKFGKWNNNILGSYITRYAEAAAIIDSSDLDYTIIRPAWLTDKNEVDYEKTGRDDTFKGTEVSRKSVAAYIFHLCKNINEDIKTSIGLNKPNTDGDKPAWY